MAKYVRYIFDVQSVLFAAVVSSLALAAIASDQLLPKVLPRNNLELDLSWREAFFGVETTTIIASSRQDKGHAEPEIFGSLEVKLDLKEHILNEERKALDDLTLVEFLTLKSNIRSAPKQFQDIEPLPDSMFSYYVESSPYKADNVYSSLDQNGIKERASFGQNSIVVKTITRPKARPEMANSRAIATVQRANQDSKFDRLQYKRWLRGNGDFTLVGIFRTKSRSWALIEDANGKIYELKVGSSLKDIEIVGAEKDKLLVSKNGTRWYLRVGDRI